MYSVLIGIFAIVFNLNARAADNYKELLICDTVRSGIHIVESNNQILLGIRNDEGFDAFPVYSGVVTKRTVPFISYALEDLKSLDGNIIVSWPKSACKIKSGDASLIECNGEGKIIAPQNSDLKTYSLYTYDQKIVGLDRSFETHEIHWGVDSKAMHHFINFPFDSSACRVGKQ